MCKTHTAYQTQTVQKRKLTAGIKLKNKWKSNKFQLNCRLMTWNMPIQIRAGLNMFAGASPLTWDSGLTVRNKKKK